MLIVGTTPLARRWPAHPSICAHGLLVRTVGVGAVVVLPPSCAVFCWTTPPVLEPPSARAPPPLTTLCLVQVSCSHTRSPAAHHRSRRRGRGWGWRSCCSAAPPVRCSAGPRLLVLEPPSARAPPPLTTLCPLREASLFTHPLPCRPPSLPVSLLMLALAQWLSGDPPARCADGRPAAGVEPRSARAPPALDPGARDRAAVERAVGASPIAVPSANFSTSTRPCIPAWSSRSVGMTCNVTFLNCPTSKRCSSCRRNTIFPPIGLSSVTCSWTKPSVGAGSRSKTALRDMRAAVSLSTTSGASAG
ncbi:hypothetical protein SAURM35S_09785 [Streptomyces aurantiogriseus]